MEERDQNTPLWSNTHSGSWAAETWDSKEWIMKFWGRQTRHKGRFSLAGERNRFPLSLPSDKKMQVQGEEKLKDWRFPLFLSKTFFSHFIDLHLLSSSLTLLGITPSFVWTCALKLTVLVIWVICHFTHLLFAELYEHRPELLLHVLLDLLLSKGCISLSTWLPLPLFPYIVVRSTSKETFLLIIDALNILAGWIWSWSVN